jgi:hypothetical protein
MPADTESRQQPAPDQPEARDDPGRMPPPEAFKAATRRLGEVVEYFWQYLSARVDLAKLRLRRLVLLAAFGVLALIALTALIVTLVVMLCSGLAGWIAAGLGGRVWAGELIVSLGLILVMAGGTWLILRQASRRRLKVLMEHYERRHREQREKFGHDAPGRAEQSSQATK